MSSILSLEGEKKATAKGIKNNIKEEELSHQDYNHTIFPKSQMRQKMVRRQHEKLQLYSMDQFQSSSSVQYKITKNCLAELPQKLIGTPDTGKGTPLIFVNILTFIKSDFI